MCRCFDRLQNISFFRDFICCRALIRWQKVDVKLRGVSCPAEDTSNLLLCITLRVWLGMTRRAARKRGLRDVKF